MIHLSGLDATFLYMETPETPMHVGGLNLFELPADYKGDFLDNLREHIAKRMHLAPVFGRKLVNMPFELANPIWVADDDVDLEYHIRSTVLPKPGNRAQLDKLVGRLHSSLLDRSRPLWEFYVIEGVETPANATHGTRHVAFYSKVHHAAVDGEAGVALAQAIMDITAVPRHVRPAPRRAALGSDNFGIAELTAAGLKNSAVQALKLAKTLPTLLRAGVQMLKPAAREDSAAGESATALSRGAMAPEKSSWFAPKTPINVSITNQRAFSSFSIPMAELKHIGRGNGVTLNDVVMAICSGALRHYLADLNCKPKQPLLAGVPVSLREDGNTDMNTQASMMRISLASHIKDPLERLQAIRTASAAAKAMTNSVKSVLPTDFPSLGAPWLLSGMASLFGRSRIANSMPPIANVAISNVPGPKVALYMAGAKMLTYYPVSIVMHSLGLNVTVQSYNGSLDWGLIACRKAMPDLPELAKYMLAAHQELLKLTPLAAPVEVKIAAEKSPEPVALKLVKSKPKTVAKKTSHGAKRVVKRAA
jgi:diacylglycerol O-acyltransferase / wax synthase